jgi:hypothetical protein
MTPTVTRTPKPALAALRRHVLGACRYGGDPRRCQVCFDFDRDASAESWRNAATHSETGQRG